MSASAAGISQIGHFQIQRLLGEGGIGRVYAALDQDLNRTVAIKALRPEVSQDPNFVERFRAEATSLARLSHPNITSVYSLHREGRELFMIMEFVQGMTLEDILKSVGRLGADELRAVAAQAASGLGYAHRMGVIHRDLKPANLMLTDSGQLKIMDFGIARIRGSQRMTREGSIIGTLAYMPPEQIKGADNDERSDIYSLACVFYELLCGAPPFQAETEYDLIQAQIGQKPAPPRQLCQGVDPGIEAALLRALSKAPADRFANAAEFARALGTSRLDGDPEDVARERILGRLGAKATRVIGTSDPDPLAGRGNKRGKNSGSGPPKPGIPLPALVLGGSALVLAAGLAAILVGAPGSGTDSASLPSGQTSETHADGSGTAHATPQGPAIPLSTTLFQPPDATPQLSASTLQSCPPKDGATDGVSTGAVAGLSDEGWPRVDGVARRLFGVQPIDPSGKQPLSDWIASKGGELVCCAVPETGMYQCVSASGHHNVALSLLMSGLAHAADGAPQRYIDAEQYAKTNRNGIWH